MSEESEMHLHKNVKNNRQQYVEFQITQHEFHTDRQSTNHSLDLALKNSRDILIASTIQFHINNPIRELLYEFRDMLKFRGFKCIQLFQNQLYLVRMTTYDKLKKLFGCIQPPKYLLSIRTHEYRSVRTVSIKPIQNTTNQSTTSSSLNEAEDLLNYLLSSKNLNKPLTNEQMNELDCEYKQDIYSLDATSSYMFSRMLVDTNYSIGKRISIIVNQFKEKKNFQETKFAQLVWINKAIGQVTEEMLEGFNCSRKELYEILGYCRKSIESYFYRCVEQNQAENSLLKESQQNVPQKDTHRQDEESIKNESFFLTLYPVSIKHLKVLIKSVISIEIFEQMFLLTEFIKIETQNNKVSEQLKHDFIDWVKEEYGGSVFLKLKALRAAGFNDKSFQSFVKQLKMED